MPAYILALDAGTTSTRAILFGERGNIIAEGRIEHELTYRNNNHYVEIDTKVLLECALSAIENCLVAAEDEGIALSDIKAFGLTNQRETLVVWDSENGEPYGPAIVWLDTRTSSMCAELKAEGKEERVKFLTGLFISPYFTATKLCWLQDNEPALKEALASKRAYVGTLDSYLIWSLTAGTEHSTDVTNASRTLLMNNQTLRFDDELKDIFGIDRRFKFPVIKPSSASFGTLARTRIKGIPIGAVIGDQHAALVGHNCLGAGQGKTTYGTGCFLIINTGERRVQSKKLLTTIAYQIEGQDPVYALEGAIGTCGTAFKYLAQVGRLPYKDGSNSKPDVLQIVPLAKNAGGPANLVIVPALTGLLAPHWCEDAEIQIFGEQPSDTDGNYIYAMLQGIAMQVVDVIEAASQDMGGPLEKHKVDGGASVNNLLMKIQADLSGAPLYRSKNPETTALGAALLAGLHTGIYPNTGAFPTVAVEEFENHISKEDLAVWRERWGECIQITISRAGRNRT